MEDRKFEQTVERLMTQDFSAGTETFREKLLARCLAVARVDDSDDVDDVMEVPDSDLDLLAAAGSPYTNGATDSK